MIFQKSFRAILCAGTLAVLVCGSVASAEEDFTAKIDRLVGITNDRDNAVNEIGFALDAGGKVSDVLYITSIGGKVVAQKSFPVAALATPDGAVFEEDRGVKAVSLHGAIDSQNGQASLALRFIANGVTGEFKSCEMKGLRKDGAWKLLNPRSLKPITQAKMLTWAFGIKTVEGICPAE